MTSMLRILPLGGLGEIGKNMTVFEYEDDIIIVDAGVMFPENDMLGVDLIIPDYHYLMEEGRLEKIRAILITHGHEDHIGALPHLVEDIKAPIYATPLTLGLIEAKLREARQLDEVELDVYKRQAQDRAQCGHARHRRRGPARAGGQPQRRIHQPRARL